MERRLGFLEDSGFSVDMTCWTQTALVGDGIKWVFSVLYRFGLDGVLSFMSCGSRLMWWGWGAVVHGCFGYQTVTGFVFQGNFKESVFFFRDFRGSHKRMSRYGGFCNRAYGARLEARRFRNSWIQTYIAFRSHSPQK